MRDLGFMRYNARNRLMRIMRASNRRLKFI